MPTSFAMSASVASTPIRCARLTARTRRAKRVMDDAPRFSDYLCENCSDRFEQVKSCLDAAGIPYVEDSRLVRGFDYYTGTVFEVQVTAGLGTQTAIGGGGHYDKLMGEISGKDLPGLGFAVGFERILLVLEELGIELAPESRPFVYVALADAALAEDAFAIVQALRDAGHRRADGHARPLAQVAIQGRRQDTGSLRACHRPRRAGFRHVHGTQHEHARGDACITRHHCRGYGALALGALGEMPLARACRLFHNSYLVSKKDAAFHCLWRVA